MVKKRGFKKLKRYSRRKSRSKFNLQSILGRRRLNFRLLKLKLYSHLITFLIVSVVGTILITPILFIWYSRSLPSPDKVQRREGFSTLILDRNEKPIYDIYSDENRIPIAWENIPESLKHATLAIEDKDFYKHQGFDPRGMIRALINIMTLQGLQGGSTLTQQLVKNVLLSSERTLPRKIKEFILAVQIERKYSKDEILQMYLNEAPYGGTMWGIESAAQGYFGKSAKELTMLESIILAGLPQRPSYYSPFGPFPEAYIDRSEEVLRRMREDKYITDVQEAELKKELKNMEFSSPKASFKAPHFVLYVKQLLIERFGEKTVEGGGLKVVTTLDLDLQEMMQEVVSEELEKLAGLNVTNAAVVVLNPETGEVLGYIGSKDYNAEEEDFQGKFDVASMGYRQPGSALKPVTYAAAFEKGYTPASLILDVETKFPGGAGQEYYIPKNYDNKFRGPVQLRFALGNSINIPAVKLTALVGVKDILETAYDMGLDSLEPNKETIERLGLSLTLGGGEVRLLDLTQAFGVFATGGVKNDAYAISEVYDSSGKKIFSHKKRSGKRVLREDVSFLISHILSDNNARKEVFGPNSYLYIPGRTVAVKTGTTDDKRDNWTVGYTTSRVVGVWVGNNDNTPMNQQIASGVTGAAPIWNRIIKFAINDEPEETFPKPDNVTALTIDAFAGGLPKDGKPTRSEYFIKGTEPDEISSIYQKIKLSKNDEGKLANLVEIATGSYTEKEYIVFQEDDPLSGGEENLWQAGIDVWLETQSDPLYHPPTDTSTRDEDKVVVNIKTPSNGQKIDQENITITAEARSTKGIRKMELFIDSDKKVSIDDDRLSEQVNLDPGVYKIKIRAEDNDDKSGESEITIGIKTDPNEQPTATPQPTQEPTQTPTP